MNLLSYSVALVDSTKHGTGMPTSKWSLDRYWVCALSISPLAARPLHQAYVNGGGKTTTVGVEAVVPFPPRAQAPVQVQELLALREEAPRSIAPPPRVACPTCSAPAEAAPADLGVRLFSPLAGAAQPPAALGVTLESCTLEAQPW